MGSPPNDYAAARPLEYIAPLQGISVSETATDAYPNELIDTSDFDHEVFPEGGYGWVVAGSVNAIYAVTWGIWKQSLC